MSFTPRTPKPLGDYPHLGQLLGRDYKLTTKLPKNQRTKLHCVNKCFYLSWGRCNWGDCVFVVTGEQLANFLLMMHVMDAPVEEQDFEVEPYDTRVMFTDVRPSEDTKENG